MIKVLVAVIICCLLISNLYLIIAHLTAKNDLPKVFGFGQVIVASGSMHPAIETGDLIIIREQKEYGKNDIITYRVDQALITHRIVEVNLSEVITKGDANNRNDDPVLLSDIEGKVVLRIPGAGNLMFFLRTPKGILSLSCLVLILYMISLMIRKLKEKKKQV